MDERHWSAPSGIGRGSGSVTGLALPDELQASPGSAAPSSGDPGADKKRDAFPRPLGDTHSKLTQDTVKQLVSARRRTTPAR